MRMMMIIQTTFEAATVHTQAPCVAQLYIVIWVIYAKKNAKTLAKSDAAKTAQGAWAVLDEKRKN